MYETKNKAIIHSVHDYVHACVVGVLVPLCLCLCLCHSENQALQYSVIWISSKNFQEASYAHQASERQNPQTQMHMEYPQALSGYSQDFFCTLVHNFWYALYSLEYKFSLLMAPIVGV